MGILAQKGVIEVVLVFLGFVFFFFLSLLLGLITFGYLSDNGEGNGNPLQYSCLENPVDRGAWWAVVHGLAQSRTRLKQLSMHVLEKEMQPTPMFLPGECQGRGSLGGLPFVGSHTVRHD